MDFSNILFRCSSLGHIMTEPRSKSEKLSEGCKTHLIDVYVSNKYGRNTDVQNKYIQKGLMVEDDSITLYSRVKKIYFKKNEAHLSNAWIKGTPDIFTGPDIHHAKTITDIKSSWDIFTFFRTHTKDINAMYFWQLQGYMDLSGAESSNLAYCLIDTPEPLINDEKRKLLWKMGAATTENEDYIQACEELERLMIYTDIPLRERLIEYTIERDQQAIDKMHVRVEECRKYLNELENNINPSVILADYDKGVHATVIEDANILK